MAEIRLNFLSEVLGMYQNVQVVLPQGRKTQVIEDAPGVLYLLHGVTDNYSMWQRYTSVERYAHENQIAVVMPDGDMSAYTNMRYGYDYFDYIAKELPEVINRTFPFLKTSRQDTSIAGMSMGGYGALKIGCTFPQRYAKVAFFSSLINPEYNFIHRDFFIKNNIPDYSENTFGSLEEIRGSENDLRNLIDTCLARKVLLPEFFMVCGKDDFFYEDNAAFCREYENKLSLRCETVDGGHQWQVWDSALRKTMQWISGERRQLWNGWK